MSEALMPSIKQNKVKINATVSGWVDSKAKKHLKDKDEKGNLVFGNYSNFVESAMIYFVSSLDKEKELKQKAEEESIKKVHDDDKNAASLLLKLLTNHPELIHEITDKSEGIHTENATILFPDSMNKNKNRKIHLE